MLARNFEHQGRVADSLAFFCVFSFMFDSGGELGLRSIGFMLLLISLMVRFRQAKLELNELRAWLASLCFLMPSIVVSSLLGIEISKIVPWVSIFFIFPIFILFVRAAKINESHFIYSGLLFAIIVIIIFLGRILQISPILEFHHFISERTAGFFNEKAAYSEDVLPVVYFQGTLTLVICGVLAAANKQKLAYGLITLALAAAPSRVGTLTCLAAGLFVLFREQKILNKTMMVRLSICTVLLAIGYFAMSANDTPFALTDNEGPSTRQLHLESVFRLFGEHPLFFIFGNGPGSEFYSSGVQAMTDNIEISQLEMLRKFGILFFTTIVLIYAWMVSRLMRAGQTPLYLALIAHFFVAASNPVLFSIPAVVLFATAIVRLHGARPITPHTPTNY